jgi:hypothetical protein
MLNNEASIDNGNWLCYSISIKQTLFLLGADYMEHFQPRGWIQPCWPGWNFSPVCNTKLYQNQAHNYMTYSKKILSLHKSAKNDKIYLNLAIF